jgi:hypothetical protein
MEKASFGTARHLAWLQVESDESFRLSDMTSLLKPYILGYRATNTCWDSAIASYDEKGLYRGHRRDVGETVYPDVTRELCDKWPMSEDGFDEWAFSQNQLQLRSIMQPLCSEVGLQLSNYLDSGFDFYRDIDAEFRAAGYDLLIGEGTSVYAVGRKEIFAAPLRKIAEQTRKVRKNL